MSEPGAFFLPEGDDRFVATELGRGPWSPGHQHAGPPSALLARAIERAVGDAPALGDRNLINSIEPVQPDTVLGAVPTAVGSGITSH